MCFAIYFIIALRRQEYYCRPSGSLTSVGTGINNIGNDKESLDASRSFLIDRSYLIRANNYLWYLGEKMECKDSVIGLTEGIKSSMCFAR